MAIQAVVVAGGRGERMRPVSETPKVMLPLGGKPILEHQINWLKRSGFDAVIFCLGYGADAVRAHFGDGSNWGMSFDYQVEALPRGTAGAVADLGPKIKSDILVVYGDLYIDMNAAKLFKFHDGHNASATVVVRHTDHPQDSDIVDAARDGKIRVVGRLKDGKVKGDLGCAAVWVVRPQLLARVPKEKPSDFAKDIVPAALADGEELRAYRTEERVIDVGTPERYEAFSKSFTSA